MTTNIALWLAFLLLLGIAASQDTSSPEESPVEAPEESPVETPVAPLLPSCSYRGYFSIKPNVVTCGPYSKYLSYIYPRCASVRVTLATKRQLYPKAYRAVWSLGGGNNNGTETPTAIKSYKRSDCPTRYLQDVPGTNLRLGYLATDWIIRPMSDNIADCYSDVGLFSPLEQKYLAMDNSCSGFTFVDDPSDAAASFKLIKLRV